MGVLEPGRPLVVEVRERPVGRTPQERHPVGSASPRGGAEVPKPPPRCVPDEPAQAPGRDTSQRWWSACTEPRPKSRVAFPSCVPRPRGRASGVRPWCSRPRGRTPRAGGRGGPTPAARRRSGASQRRGGDVPGEAGERRAHPRPRLRVQPPALAVRPARVPDTGRLDVLPDVVERHGVERRVGLLAVGPEVDDPARSRDPRATSCPLARGFTTSVFGRPSGFGSASIVAARPPVMSKGPAFCDPSQRCRRSPPAAGRRDIEPVVRFALIGDRHPVEGARGLGAVVVGRRCRCGPSRRPAPTARPDQARKMSPLSLMRSRTRRLGPPRMPWVARSPTRLACRRAIFARAFSCQYAARSACPGRRPRKTAAGRPCSRARGAGHQLVPQERRVPDDELGRRPLGLDRVRRVRQIDQGVPVDVVQRLEDRVPVGGRSCARSSTAGRRSRSPGARARRRTG